MKSPAEHAGQQEGRAAGKRQGGGQALLPGGAVLPPRRRAGSWPRRARAPGLPLPPRSFQPPFQVGKTLPGPRSCRLVLLGVANTVTSALRAIRRHLILFLLK